MNDEIPLEAPPVDDDQLGGGGNLPAGRGATPPGRSPSQGSGASAGKPAKPAQPGKKNLPNNMPPVGDIQLKKKSGTYNTYTIQLSYGQIEALRQALEADHANPIGDELKALFDYYINSIPGPGEEEDDVKAREEQAAIANGEMAAATGDDDNPIPMPPGDEGGGEITVAGEGPEDMGGEGGGDDGIHMPPVEGEEGQELPEPPGAMPDFTEQDADDRLPSPPRE